MTAPKAKNLVSGTLAESITTSTTNILVHIGDNVGAQTITNFFPTAPFYITVMPKSPVVNVANRLDSEIMLITAVSHDQVGNAALTATRAQRDTTAKAFGEGDIVTVGSYCDDAVFLDDTGSSETPQPWINDSDIITNSTTDANGWTVLKISNNATIYRKKFPFTNIVVPGTAGQGSVATTINKPVGVTFDESDILGESVYSPTAEVYFHRIDSISATTCRMYVVNATNQQRTINGDYVLTCLKITS